MKWQQLNVDLPGDLPAKIDEQTVRRLAGEDLNALRAKHRIIDEFFK